MKQEMLKQEPRRKNQDTQFFCIGYSIFWRKPIHKKIKKLRNSYGLTWLRVAMSYHQFPNIRNTFKGNLSKKLLHDIMSKDFEMRECNCQTNSKTNGTCVYKSKFRHACVIFKVTCKTCGVFNTGNTQQFFKNRMRAHFLDV